MIRNNLLRMENKVTNVMEDRVFDFLMDNVIEKGLENIKNHFGFSVLLGYDFCGNLKDVYKWIKKYYSNYKNLFDINENYGNIKNKTFIIKFRNDTYAYVSTGLKIKSTKYLFNKYYSTAEDIDHTSNMISIYIFGKKAHKYYNELMSIVDLSTSADLYQFIVSGSSANNKTVHGEMYTNISSDSMNVLMQPLKKRDMDTLFYDQNVKEDIENHINNFLESKYIYIEKDIPFKTGILLYGYPGTGKSSLVQALANKYHVSLVNIDTSTFANLDTASLKESIEADDDMYIVLLEDIDTIFNLKREDETDKEDKKVINKLLQFLDSPTKSPTNVIFIATTNHIEALDSAILRTGRFDIKKEITPICRSTAIKMCESFDLKESTIDEIISNCTFPVNQSYLQGEILKFIKIETLKKSKNNYDDIESISNRKVVVDENGSSVLAEDNE